MGLFIKKAVTVKMSLLLIMKSTMPHFLEYVSLWITGSIGLHGISVFKNLLHGNIILKKQDLQKTFIVTCICLVFTLIAAYVEAHFIGK